MEMLKIMESMVTTESKIILMRIFMKAPMNYLYASILRIGLRQFSFLKMAQGYRLMIALSTKKPALAGLLFIPKGNRLPLVDFLSPRSRPTRDALASIPLGEPFPFIPKGNRTPVGGMKTRCPNL
jgi:hypothetical protein